MDNYGFIITRHVNSELTNKYWNNSVKLLNTFYPLTQIVIIDDNSKPEFIVAEFDHKNITIINSEFKGRGELLPYYYYLKNKFFKNAVILHDSVFFHAKYDFDKLLGIRVLPLWFFYPDKENVNNTLRLVNLLNNNIGIQQKINNNSIITMPNDKWFGCFGVQSYINHEFLVFLNMKYNIVRLVTQVQCRKDRCCLERIFGAIFFTENKKIINRKSLLGNIMEYQKWGYSYKEYMNDIKKGKLPKIVVKVWTGR
uniref:Glycosyltransferase n=1 Tax=viral metagenome TaxID=1070528 RepID=A0A6C0EQN7_9ZZZZ